MIEWRDDYENIQSQNNYKYADHGYDIHIRKPGNDRSWD